MDTYVNLALVARVDFGVTAAGTPRAECILADGQRVPVVGSTEVTALRGVIDYLAGRYIPPAQG
jgi:hypothetical protein